MSTKLQLILFFVLSFVDTPWSLAYCYSRKVGYLCTYVPSGPQIYSTWSSLHNVVLIVVVERAKKTKKYSVFTFNTFVVNLYSRWTINIFFNNFVFWYSKKTDAIFREREKWLVAYSGFNSQSSDRIRVINVIFQWGLIQEASSLLLTCLDWENNSCLQFRLAA